MCQIILPDPVCSGTKVNCTRNGSVPKKKVSTCIAAAKRIRTLPRHTQSGVLPSSVTFFNQKNKVSLDVNKVKQDK